MSDKEIEEILNEIRNNGENKPVKKSTDLSFEEVYESIKSKPEPPKELEPDFSFFGNDNKEDKSSETDDELIIKLEDDSKPASENPVDTTLFEFDSNSTNDEKDDSLADLFKENESLFSSQEPFSAPLDEEMNVSDMFSIEEVQDNKKSRTKKLIIALVAIVVAVAVGVGVYFAFFNKEDTPQPETTNPVVEEVAEPIDTSPKNPLTGESGFSETALAQRPVAVVVENEYSTESVRPQWGLKDADIVLEGESEFSTRLLLFWADFNQVPKQVGPTRSARPPFIRFSQLFDAVFIHAGLSRSKGSYVGADTVFSNENVDHINLLSYSENGTYFGRDYDRTRTVEHTGYLNGTNTAKLLEEAKIRTSLNTERFTKLSFNSETVALSQNAAEEIVFKWSSNCPKKAKFTYDSESHKYTTKDFDSDYGKANVAWENVILILDTTEYVVKENYKHKGNSETYCNYNLAGGEGIICSEGTYVDITWGVTKGKLWMKTSDGKEVKLNPGKTYIGYGSSNHKGFITIETPDATSNQ